MDEALVWRARSVLVSAGRKDLVFFTRLQDLLVLDLEFGIALGLFADHLPIGVILARVRSDIGQDGHLVDVGIVLGVQSFEFRMQCFVAGAGQSGIAFTDLEEGISFMEVGVIVISR